MVAVPAAEVAHQVVNLNLVEVVAVGFEVGGLCILRGLHAVGKCELENVLHLVRERQGVALDEPVDPDPGERLGAARDPEQAGRARRLLRGLRPAVAAGEY